MKTPITLAIVGAGNRGIEAYAPYTLQYPEKGKIVAVAEPRDARRARAAELYDIPHSHVFSDWRELYDAGKCADAVIITTQDKDHRDPAIAFMEQGYHVLLEKPMAVTEQDCRDICTTALRMNTIFAVGHVLRYTPYTRKLVSLLREGVIGDIISIQHIEPVGWWHYAHSYVRGNWRNTGESSFMLMTKSCHDMDYLRYLADAPCRSVSSYGSLTYFRPENAPPNAAKRCVNCPKKIEKDCPYSALKIYSRGKPDEWPASVITAENTAEGIQKALETGPYGRCVFHSDNDVVDHQVVIAQFENDITATFTMTAFTGMSGRETRIMGTRGELRGDSRYIRVYDFVREKETVHDSQLSAEGDILSGHGGGDTGLMSTFLDALINDDAGRILSGPQETLESHLMTFAAERARLKGTVEHIN